MHAHGIAVVLVFETTAYRAVDGYDAGKYDANIALDQARLVSWPNDRPIYFAVDFAATPDQVSSYLHGVRDTLGPARVGVYGSYDIVKWTLDTGTAKYAWQTTAWSVGQRDPRINLFQRLGAEIVDGVNCDVNEALTGDYGQWPTDTGGFLMALEDWEQRRVLDRVLRASKGVEGQDFDGEQWKFEQAWRDAVDAKLAALDAKVSAIQGTLATEEANLLGAIKAAPAGQVDTKALATALTGAGLPAQVASALLAVLSKAAVPA